MTRVRVSDHLDQLQVQSMRLLAHLLPLALAGLGLRDVRRVGVLQLAYLGGFNSHYSIEGVGLIHIIV
jgi:hypothetical protein